MTRFQQEISGLLDKQVYERKIKTDPNYINNHYWENSAKAEVLEKVEEADKKAYVDLNGVIRWKESNNILMDDYCEILEYAGYDFSRENTLIARKNENRKSLNEYRKNTTHTSDEFIAEVRAAVGTGVKMVDILSGYTFTT